MPPLGVIPAGRAAVWPHNVGVEAREGGHEKAAAVGAQELVPRRRVGILQVISVYQGGYLRTNLVNRKSESPDADTLYGAPHYRTDV